MQTSTFAFLGAF